MSIEPPIQQPATPFETQTPAAAEKPKAKPKLPPEPPKPFLGFDALELPPVTLQEQRAHDKALGAASAVAGLQESEKSALKRLKEIRSEGRKARRAQEASDNAAAGATLIAALTPDLRSRGFTNDGLRRFLHLAAQTSLTMGQVAALIASFRVKP